MSTAFEETTNCQGPKSKDWKKMCDTTEPVLNAFLLNKNRILAVMGSCSIVYVLETKIGMLHQGRVLFRIPAVFSCCIPDGEQFQGALSPKFFLGFSDPAKSSSGDD